MKITITMEREIKDVDIEKLRKLDSDIKSLDTATVIYPTDIQNLLNKGNVFVKGREGKWIDAYLSNEIDASLFAYLIVLEKLFSKKNPPKIKEIINQAIECLVSNKPLTPKKEQEIKKILNEAKRASNEGDSDGVDSAMEKIIDIARS
ncbi:hypothetical protein AGMMS4952_04340 [Spirochaetia bacterium]|nr:hypothetical protein AGMMS4952_04340 [Spirochaetia bacterium]